MRQTMHRWPHTWPKPTPAQTLFGTSLCLLIALMAQRSLDRHTAKAVPLAMLGAASLGFAVFNRRIAIEGANDTSDGQKYPAVPLSPIMVTSGISLLGCLDFGGNQFRPLGVAVWIGGLLLTLLYLWLVSPASALNPRLSAWRERKRLWFPAYCVVLLAIVLVGAWLRFRLINEIPAEMGFDLADKYFDSLTIAQGKYQIFFPARLGREGLFFYSVALLGRIAGLGEWTLHLASSLFGTLTIVAVFFLAQEAFNRQVGLLAAFLLAVNRWHVVLSRTGFRACTMPLFTALALHAFIRALRTRRPLDFGWAGIALGMGVYGYRSFLFVPVALLAGLLLYLAAKGWAEFRPVLPGLLVIAFVAVAVVAPLARYAIQNPDKYLARERYQLKAMAAQKERSPGLLAYYQRSLLAFNYMGDTDPRFNVPMARQMGLVSAVLLVLGLGYVLWRWRHGYNGFLLAALFILILPAALSMLPDELPNSLRMAGAIVPAVVLAALPLPLIAEQIRQARSRGWLIHTEPAPVGDETLAEEAFGIALTLSAGTKRQHWAWRLQWAHLALGVLAIVASALLAYEVREVNRFYFRDYIVRLPEMSNYSVTREIAREIEHYGVGGSVYVKPWPNWFDSSVLQLHLHTDRSWNPFLNALVPQEPPLSTIQGTALFIVHPADQAALATLRAVFPRNVARPRYYPNGELSFYAFYVER